MLISTSWWLAGGGLARRNKVWPTKAKTNTFCLFHFAVIGLILAYTLPTSFKYWVTTYTPIIYFYNFLRASRKKQIISLKLKGWRKIPRIPPIWKHSKHQKGTEINYFAICINISGSVALCCDREAQYCRLIGPFLELGPLIGQSESIHQKTIWK